MAVDPRAIRRDLRIDDPGRSGGGLSQAATDLAAYPILTEEVSHPSAPRPSGGPSAPGSAPLGQIVASAVRDVLGWRPDARKPAAFVAALKQAFDLKETEGRVEWKWTPRSYAVQTDLGAVTGAQASIYTRAREALEGSLPLLDGLYPLRADTVEDDRRAISEIARQQMEQLVAEFGVLGGPRVQRVDEKFAQLLGGEQFNAQFPQRAGNPELLPSTESTPGLSSTLGELRDRFGLTRDRVNTVVDEQNLTNYVVVVDYLLGLRQSWNAQRPLFAISQGGANAPEPFLGTQLVLLSRALEVVAEAVRETYFAMDSVFMGPAERQTTLLRFANLPDFPLRQSDLFVADLLDWIDRVASDEGPRVIQSSGKDGVLALVPELDTLGQLARAALIDPQRGGRQNGLRIPASYRAVRVQAALDALASQIEDAASTAAKIRPQRASPNGRAQP
jgi:hypothetical protein